MPLKRTLPCISLEAFGKVVKSSRVATWSDRLYLYLRITATRSLARSLAERAKVAERPASRENEGEQG